MSALRPTLTNSTRPAVPAATAYYLIAAAVRQVKGLIHGQLRNKETGRTCALGAYWDANPNTCLMNALIDEVAAVNDSMPEATQRERQRGVLRWLRYRMKTLEK